MSRKKIVAGNWKMNLDIHTGVNLAKSIAEKLGNLSNAEVVLCPPALMLWPVSELLNDSVQLGAQNCHWESDGAYTGEHSVQMLASAGVTWVIIGHSERRQFFGESNETVNLKIKAALDANLHAVLCVGESLSERQSGKHFEVVDAQLREGLSGIEKLDHLVVAYEPVWAIGTGETATPDQAQEIHAHLRKSIKQLYGDAVAGSTRILYGGSCKPTNAVELFGMTDIDGGLIGGAALKSDDFLAIVSAAQ